MRDSSRARAHTSFMSLFEHIHKICGAFAMYIYSTFYARVSEEPDDDRSRFSINRSRLADCRGALLRLLRRVCPHRVACVYITWCTLHMCADIHKTLLCMLMDFKRLRASRDLI